MEQQVITCPLQLDSLDAVIAKRSKRADDRMTVVCGM